MIYVLPIYSSGLPKNSIIIDAEDGYEDAIATADLGELDKEIATYHRDFRPRTCADILYVWEEKTVDY